MEQMLGVRCAFLLLLFSGYLWVGSQSIDGSFKLEQNGYFTKIEFLDGYRFKKVSSYENTHGVHFAEGYYLTQKDSLIMFYDSMKIPNGVSKYNVESKTKIKDHYEGTIISLKILDHKHKPLGQAIVALYKENDLLSVYEPNKSGNYFIQTEGQIATHIKISNFEVLEIPLKQFWGFSANVVAIIKPYDYNSFNQSYYIEKYLIIEKGDDKLELRNTNSDKTLILKESK